MGMNQDEVWVPVNLRGFRIGFEMNGAGFVRCREREGQGRWLLPQAEHGDDAGLGYRLCFSGREGWLPLQDIFKAFGTRVEADWKWIDQTRLIVDAENRMLEERARLRDPLGAMLQEAEGDYLIALLNTLSRGCPWERSRIVGDARGADPILGF
ncbi:hypothetical protein [Desulfovibrio ferrophilus]|uniref:Phage tail tape measure protein n=1 Tax=Desulfovibrio ferrophilus TaxID=241368 RepID=A0A2Z6AZY8_9BACT|nr:hypothetical protein [Desulfovibrio ferrophilus]BBD08763.1 phage tail tape measure protein [Desulfovibrio ferrophilus]